MLNLSEKYLSISVGLIVFIAGAGSFFGWEINRNTLNSFFAGTFSGIFGMIAAIGGPPVALLYRNTKSEEFRPSLNSVFSIGILITLSLIILFISFQTYNYFSIQAQKKISINFFNSIENNNEIIENLNDIKNDDNIFSILYIIKLIKNYI